MFYRFDLGLYIFDFFMVGVIYQLICGCFLGQRGGGLNPKAADFLGFLSDAEEEGMAILCQLMEGINGNFIFGVSCFQLWALMGGVKSEVLDG